jgi:hypothetical protein
MGTVPLESVPDHERGVLRDTFLLQRTSITGLGKKRGFAVSAGKRNGTNDT